MKNRFRIATSDEIDGVRWDEAVASSAEAWLWHRRPFLDALSTWSGYVDFSFAVIDDRGAVVGLHPLHAVRKGKSPVRTPFLDSQGGLAVVDGTSPKVAASIWELAREHLQTTASRERSVSLRISLPALAPANRPGGSCVNPLLERGFENTQTQTWLIHLRDGQLEKRYSANARQEIRKARDDVAIRDAEPSHLDAYYRLHLATYQSTGVTPHPYEYFRCIFEQLIPLGYARILLAYRAGRLLAAQNTAVDKEAGLYWTGASDPDARGGENRLLGHLQLERCRALGHPFYDMGEAFPGGTGKKRGLSDFKRSFGAELHPLFRGERLYRPWMALARSTAKAAREIQRSR